MTLKLPVLTLKAISAVPVTKDSLEMVLFAQVCLSLVELCLSEAGDKNYSLRYDMYIL